MLGTKIFGDFYSIDEIALLEEFSFFLENHLKYIDTYSSLQDLSLNLDKKVDDKTIEYNDLINRQKEFIALISHEIKSPLSSAIFQSDSILHDLDTIEPNADKMREELTVLNTQLVRTG
jgi:signal transduction histidine kinase